MLQQTPPVPAEDCLVPLSTFGIGSVPFIDGENACEKIFQRWDIPSWPQYPTRDPRENFIFQFLKDFPGLDFTGAKFSFDPGTYEKEKEAHRSRLTEAFSEENFISFEPDPEWALGYSEMKTLLGNNFAGEKRVVKLQITGPGVIWHSFFKGENLGNLTEEVQGLLVDTLIACGLGQIQRIRDSKRKAIIVIDEPILDGDLPFTLELIEQYRDARALVGLHVCSSANWSGLDRLSLDLFHFDFTAISEFDSFSKDFLRNFVLRKKWIAWGVVPTRPASEFSKKDYADVVLKSAEEICRRDLTLEQILKHSLLAPACGTGMLSSFQDESVSESLKATQRRLKSQLDC